MTLASRFTFALLTAVLLAATGCVGPMACGPGACDARGPLAFNHCDGCDGCGELYIDPWINHPADACDPCDRCGNFNGQSCGKCRSVFGGLRSLWGYRCDRDCDSGCDSMAEPTCGCDLSVGHEPSCGYEPSCGMDGSACGGCASCGGTSYPPSMPMSERHYPSLPTPAEEVIIEGSPTSASMERRRTRQIFRSRAGLVTGPTG